MSKKNKLEDLRDYLFAVIEGLNDKNDPMDMARAATIASVAQTIINSAKVEVEFLKVTENKQGAAFFNGAALGAPAPGSLQVGKRGKE